MTGLSAAIVATVRRYLASLPPDRQYGQVEITAPLTVLFPGDTAAVAVPLRSASYTPAVGDRVVLERVGSSWVVVYKVVSA